MWKKHYCKKKKYVYDCNLAQNEYQKKLQESRSIVKISKDEIAALNEVISPLMINQHHGVNQVYIEHPEIFFFC